MRLVRAIATSEVPDGETRGPLRPLGPLRWHQKEKVVTLEGDVGATTSQLSTTGQSAAREVDVRCEDGANSESEQIEQIEQIEQFLESTWHSSRWKWKDS